jgi:predicted nucleotidyltransferase
MHTREQIISECEKFFKKRASQYKVENAFLYGSWARGYPRQDSDIDIAVMFLDESCSEDITFERITAMSVSLVSEIGLEVNIIAIHRDFNEPMLYYNAIVLGEPVFIKDYAKYIDLKNEAIYQMEDFSIFGIDWQINAAKRNLEVISHA